MSLFVIVPGFGAPHTQKKLEILQSNLAIIRSHPWTSLEVVVCAYDSETTYDMHPRCSSTYEPIGSTYDSESTYDMHPRCSSTYEPLGSTHDSESFPGVRWVEEKGVVGDFIRRHASAITTDYVMILLDDVELQPDVNFTQLLEFQRQFQFDIVSPTLTRKSKYQFEYMRTNPFEPYDIKVVACCECFCLFFPAAAYQKYYALLTPHNPWLWGLDMMLWKVFGFNIGMLNRMTMHHHYKGESYAPHLPNPAEGYQYEIKKYGVNNDDLVNQPAEHYWITMNPLRSVIP